MDITQIVFYGVLILIVFNLTLFFALLINKVSNNRKKEEDRRLKAFYEAMTYQYVHQENKEAVIPKNAYEMRIQKNVILDAFMEYDPVHQGRLRMLAWDTGFVDEEMKALKNPSDLRKAVAAYALGILRIRESLPMLKSIRTSHRELSQCVTRALIQIGGTEEIDHVLDHMRKSDSPQKTKVLELISEIVEEDIFPKMKEYIMGEDVLKKSLALEALGIRKDTRVIPYIQPALGSMEKEVKISALKAATSLRAFDCEALKEEIKLLFEDQDWEIRSFTAKAMSVALNMNQEVLEGLKKLMEDSNWFVRFNASESLFQLGERGIEALSENLFSQDSFARDKAWGILNREMALFSLEERIKGFSNQESIWKNINAYRIIRMEVKENAS